MTLAEIEELTSLLGSFGIGALVGGFAIYLGIKSFVPAYLSEKAKNLATKEDVETITDKIESVKAGYAEVLEEVRSNYKLKFAAVEREKAIKKEVYMDAVEAITRTQNSVAAFSNLMLSDESITSSFASDAGKIAKVQVVGSAATVQAVTQFMSAVGTATLDLMLVRGELLKRKHAIEVAVEYRDLASNELDRYIEMMKNLNLAGNKDPNLWNTINENVEFEQKRRDDHQREIDSLCKTQEIDHLAFTRQCIDRFFELSELLPDALLSVRSELDMDISDEEYLTIFNENIAVGKRAFANFLARVEGE